MLDLAGSSLTKQDSKSSRTEARQPEESRDSDVIARMIVQVLVHVDVLVHGRGRTPMCERKANAAAT